MSSDDSSSASDYEDIDSSDNDSDEEVVCRGFVLVQEFC